MNIAKINKNIFFITFYLLTLRSVVVTLLGLSVAPALTVGLPVLFFSIAARRDTILTLFIFFALIPLLHGLQMLGILPDVAIVSLCFAGIYIAWLPKYYFRTPKKTEKFSAIEQLVDWLALVIILSLLMILLQYPVAVSLQAISNIIIDGVQDRFWGIEAAGIILQGLVFFRIYTLESREAKINRQRYFFYALFLQIIFIFIFAAIQFYYALPATYRYHSGQIHSPFDDIHSLGSILIMYFFVVSSALPSLRKKWLCFSLTILAGIVLLTFNTGSATTYVALALCLSISVGLLINRKLFFLYIVIIATSFIFYNLHPGLLNNIKNPKIHRVARRLLLSDPAKGSVTARLEFADRALGIIAAYPISGSGIGSFWRESRDYHFFSDKPHAIKIENAHNYYLQLAADAGIPALVFFLAIFYLVFSSGFKKIRLADISSIEKSSHKGFLLGIAGYLITMFAGHPLLLPVQQFCFWMIIAQAVDLQNSPLSDDASSRQPNFLLCTIFVALLLGGSFYRIKQYRTSSDYGYGTYPFENWNGKKERWIDKYSAIKKFADSNILGIIIHVSPYNIDKEKGLRLTLSVNNNEIDQCHFFSAGEFPFYYYLPNIKGKEITIQTALSKTFNPKKLGLNSDKRNLGVGLEAITFLQIIPSSGFGFYSEENVADPQFPKFKDMPTVQGRWIGRRATINLADFRDTSLQLYYKCAHPNIEQRPTKIAFYLDNQQVLLKSCKTSNWRLIKFDQQQLNEHKLLTISIDRTWNPKISGLSEDTRDLGLFLVILPGN